MDLLIVSPDETVPLIGTSPLEQGSPTPGPISNRATQQEVSGWRVSKCHLPLPIAPHRSHYCLNHPPSPWENCLPRNRSLVPKRLGSAALEQSCGDGKHVDQWRQKVGVLISCCCCDKLPQTSWLKTTHLFS